VARSSQKGKKPVSGVAVVQIAPQRVQHRVDEQGCGDRSSHLGLVDAKGLHDGRGQGADEELVGLMQEHEGKEDSHREPAMSRCRVHRYPFRCPNPLGLMAAERLSWVSVGNES
jgi:hypothetical protein